MGNYRILSEFDYEDAKGNSCTSKIGGLINIRTRQESAHLLRFGYIGPLEVETNQPNAGKAASPKVKTKRIGIWLKTSNFYSGGRIHMYQYAWTMAKLGAEVYLITNMHPKWMRDYPKQDGVKVLIEGNDKVPCDLDVIITDSKGALGRSTLTYKKQHPSVPFFCMNFETSNWVNIFCPDYADRLQAPKDVFQKADRLLANSGESAKYLTEWVGKPTPVHVLQPAVNTFAIREAETKRSDPKARPYAVWSARSPVYKGGSVALEAIWALKIPFDLVMFGQPPEPLADNHLHKAIYKRSACDADKFRTMLDADLILAPSKFEGYGMVPGEALACGKPCVVYDLPVLRAEYGDRLVYAKWGNEEDYKEKVRQIATEDVTVPVDATEARELYGMGAMEKRVETIPHHAMQRKSVSAHMIAYWGFLPESLEAIYQHVDQIEIAFGPVPHAMKIDDGSLDRINLWVKEHDTDNKIHMEVRKEWSGKKEMRQFCVDRCHGNYQLLLDGDEIWVGLAEWIAADYPFDTPRWLNFWHDLDHWVYDCEKLAGKRWGRKLDPFGSDCNHYRWSWWRSSYYFRRHPAVVDMNNEYVRLSGSNGAKQVPQCCIYHLGHCLPSNVMQAKHEFYLNRDGNDLGRQARRDSWHNWKGEIGDCGDGIVEAVEWKVPGIVRRAYESMKAVTV